MEKAVKVINVLADTRETVVPIPPIVEQVQVEVPVVGIAIQHQHVAIAIRIQDVLCKVSSTPPSFEYSLDCI